MQPVPRLGHGGAVPAGLGDRGDRRVWPGARLSELEFAAMPVRAAGRAGGARLTATVSARTVGSGHGPLVGLGGGPVGPPGWGGPVEDAWPGLGELPAGACLTWWCRRHRARGYSHLTNGYGLTSPNSRGSDAHHVRRTQREMALNALACLDSIARGPSARPSTLRRRQKQHGVSLPGTTARPVTSRQLGFAHRAGRVTERTPTMVPANRWSGLFPAVAPPRPGRRARPGRAGRLTNPGAARENPSTCADLPAGGGTARLPIMPVILSGRRVGRGRCVATRKGRAERRSE